MAAGRSTADDFRLAREARQRYGLADLTLAPDLATARTIAARMNQVRDTSALEPPARGESEAGDAGDLDGAGSGQQAPPTAGELHAAGLLVAILGRLVDYYRTQTDPAAIAAADRWLRQRLGPAPLAAAVTTFATEFPARLAVPEPPDPASAITQLLLLGTLDENEAVDPFRDLVDLSRIRDGSRLVDVVERLDLFFTSRPGIGADGTSLVDVLRQPAAAAPVSLADQLRWIRDHWAGRFEGAIDDLLDRLLIALDVLAEERMAAERAWFAAHDPGAGGPSEVYEFGNAQEEVERFSDDTEWMPKLVLIAKSTYVWLDQLSRRYSREIRTLDAIPDEELDRLSGWGITGLWLIGLWERSRASERIKRMRGDPDAVASAYSLDDYVIAADLGGDAALATLRSRAAARGLRLASDMVPNHMGIDSRWVIDRPDRFLSLPASPFPGYTFDGPDLSSDERVAIRIEDHYYDGTDAAVVFQRVDRAAADVRYVYHGNDGTSYPWNDTAQLDYSRADVREAIIQTILDVARRFPVIRFDAAMVLAKKHVQRLWFPEPGAGGAIPSRAGHGMTRAEFDRAMPTEFWRDVVDRVATEVPGTLLLAEAFWLLEGYFVRTLGMHRVYNSAFMNMMRDERNAEYRLVIRNTLEFDPAILGRFVNFMSNPDERTAVDQFGTGDKYFGVATLMATLPGLPMFGHGQVEGFTEKYGMEFRRARLDEPTDQALLEHHGRAIFPLLHRRSSFAGSDGFRLYDVLGGDGHVNEDVFAYSNAGPAGDRSLVIFHNRYAETHGQVGESVGYMARDTDGGRSIRREDLASGLGLSGASGRYVVLRDAMSGQEWLHSSEAIARDGLSVDLRAYECRVFLDVHEIADGPRPVARLFSKLAGRGVPSIEDELRRLELEPVHQPVHASLEHAAVVDLIRSGVDRLGARERSRAAAPARDLDGALARAAGAIGGGMNGASTAVVARSRLEAIGRLAEGSAADELAAGGPRAHRAVPADRSDPLLDVRPAFADPWHRAVLAGWAIIEAMLTAAKQLSGSGPRIVFDELRLDLPLTEALRSAGLDGSGARLAADRVRILIALPRPSTAGGRSAVERRRRLVEGWLADPEVRAFIRLNRWDGIDWVGREEFRELLDWALLLDAIDVPATGRAEPGGAAPDRAVAMSSSVVHALARAGEKAGYRVDRLLVGGGPAGRTPGRLRSGRAGGTGSDPR